MSGPFGSQVEPTKSVPPPIPPDGVVGPDRDRVVVTLRGCDDRTRIELDVTDAELRFLEVLAAGSEDASEGSCQPVLGLRARVESDDLDENDRPSLCGDPAGCGRPHECGLTFCHQTDHDCGFAGCH